MRTTLTLDHDVAVQIETLRRERKTTLKGAVNAALRQGLRVMAETQPARRGGRTREVALGRCLLATIDDVSETLAIAEGEAYR
ncbi:MAG: CopG family transcriptional regulator [Candidatus Marinimicrobia bacterium]|nr:CopG family transcriptional regulator [Candidatus Neomarinimicrobiota bacterium]